MTPAETPRIQTPRTNGIIIRSKSCFRALGATAPPRAGALYNNAASGAKQESRGVPATETGDLSTDGAFGADSC